MAFQVSILDAIYEQPSTISLFGEFSALVNGIRVENGDIMNPRGLIERDSRIIDRLQFYPIADWLAENAEPEFALAWRRYAEHPEIEIVWSYYGWRIDDPILLGLDNYDSRLKSIAFAVARIAKKIVEIADSLGLYVPHRVARFDHDRFAEVESQ